MLYICLGPQNTIDIATTFDSQGKLKSETILKDDRRYYLDLKENQRGRFLRVSTQLLLRPKGESARTLS